MKNLIFGLMILLCGCTSTQYVAQAIDRPQVIPPNIQELNLDPTLEITVLNYDRLKDLYLKVESLPDDQKFLWAGYYLTPRNLEVWTANTLEANRYIGEQDRVIKFYTDYLQSTEKTVKVEDKPKD